MSRTDAKQLNVPEVPQEPSESENIKQSDSTESQVGAFLDAMEKKQVLINKCPGCKSSLSGIERKMGRCLTCGKTIESAKDAKDSQDASSKPTPKFEVRL